MKFFSVFILAIFFCAGCADDITNNNGSPSADFDIYLVRRDIQNSIYSTYTIKSDGSDLKLFNDSLGVSNNSYRNKILLFKGNYILSNIYIAEYDGSGMTSIPLEHYQVSYCNLSPDAEKLYFVTDSPSKSLFVVNSNGSELVQISDIQIFEYGSYKFSPNGKLIAYFEPSYWQFAAKLFISNTAGTYKKTIVDSLNIMAGVALDWSPDGSRIVYQDYSFDLQAGKICVIDTARNSYLELAHGYFPAWSPKGDKICFVKFIGSRSDIFIMDQDGTNIFNITNTTSTDESNIKWSKDGMKILYNSYGSEQSPKVWMYDLNANLNTLLADSVYGAVWQ